MTTWKERQAERHLGLIREWVDRFCILDDAHVTSGMRLYGAYCEDSQLGPKPNLNQFYSALEKICTRHRHAIGIRFAGIGLKRDFKPLI